MPTPRRFLAAAVVNGIIYAVGGDNGGVSLSTIEGTKGIDAWVKANEPPYFQEFGPGGFHVAIGFANPALINARKAGFCASTPFSSRSAKVPAWTRYKRIGSSRPTTSPPKPAGLSSPDEHTPRPV